MEYREWAPYYHEIQSDFGFPFDEERGSRDALAERLPAAARGDPLPRLRPLIVGRDAIIAGLAPRAGPPPVWTLPPREPRAALFAADGATTVCLEAGLVPDVIVTDLDGPVAAEVTANARGGFAVLHAHGDNRPAIEHWTTEFRGRVAGSWAGAPEDGLLDVGGFTDGDRAAFLAEHLGARRILLWGFDFRRVEETDEASRATKARKLEWARRLLGMLAGRSAGRLFVWNPDGTIVPYAAEEAAQPAPLPGKPFGADTGTSTQ